MSTAEDLGTAPAGLERASRPRLAEQGAEYYGVAPPPRTSRSLMIRAVAHKMQERKVGGLSAATRRLLSGQAPAPVLQPARAQHLVRQVVHVLQDEQPGNQPRRQRRLTSTWRADPPCAVRAFAPGQHFIWR
jgi:hypothetical protein